MLGLALMLFRDVQPVRSLLHPSSDSSCATATTTITPATPTDLDTSAALSPGHLFGSTLDDLAVHSEQNQPIGVSSCYCVALHVAPLIGLNFILTGLGSGMIYKFIPMFCWKELALGPIATHAMIASFQLLAVRGNYHVYERRVRLARSHDRSHRAIYRHCGACASRRARKFNGSSAWLDSERARVGAPPRQVEYGTAVWQ